MVVSSDVPKRCYFNQFIVINDNQTSNLLSICMKSKQVKHTREIGQVGRREKQREQIRGDREVALIRRGNGMR
jgi:hypothetical protein